MLANMFADAFELDNYTNCTEQSLFNNAGLAIQLESLERLGEPQDTGMEGVARRFRTNHDVIVLDEIESLLAHLRSSTLKKHLALVWKLFISLIRDCTCLVVCDADIGPRSFEFLRMTRRDNGIISGLQYHINHHIAIRTRFLDYAGVSEWKDALLRTLLQGKNVFYFSNNKTHMRTIERYIRDEMVQLRKDRVSFLRAKAGESETLNYAQMSFGSKRYITELVNNDTLIQLYSNIETEILVIDANMSEAEKK
jgi:hypothetical protein